MELLRRLFGRRRAGPAPPGPPLTREQVDAELKAWSVATLDNAATGETGLVRIRTRKPELADIAAFRTAVAVHWAYDPASPFPPPDVMERMTAFEEAIDPLTWMNGFAELVLVMTGKGDREWLFYTRDYDRFMATLNALLAARPPFPLRIEFDDDPAWEAWAAIAGPLREREKP